ncbi:MAG: hypothetical protein C4534_01260 [Gaiellales bacterium]|nr:MAG: hypothetical protein C4534_01260 [Gaiellales bacterium]
MQFLRAVRDSVSPVIFVLTKADLLTESEREEMLNFIQKVLHEQAGYSSQEVIWPVSAHVTSDQRAAEDFARAMRRLKAHLHAFVGSRMQAVLPQAIRAKAARVLGEALFALDLQWKAVTLPRQELLRRSKLFEAQLAQIEQERGRFGDLLACDLSRCAYRLDQLAVTMATVVRDALLTHASRMRNDLGGMNAPLADCHIRAALTSELDTILLLAKDTFLAEAGMQFAAIEDGHIRTIEGAIARIRRAAADMFEVPCLDGIRLTRLENIREPRLVTRRWSTSFLEHALLWSVRWLPARWQGRYLERKLAEDIACLATQNVQELRWTVHNTVRESLRGFQVRMENQIGETVSAIRMSIWSALARQDERESGWDPQYLEEKRRHLTELLSKLAQTQDEFLPGRPL